MARLAAMLTSVDPHSYAACCQAIARFDFVQDVAKIDVPTLVLAAHDDRGLPPHHSVTLSDTIPNAAYVELAGGAHLPWLEQPSRVVVAVHDHVHGGPVVHLD
jgi:pimeloyl-ACP methyl ester carboxylesterase